MALTEDFTQFARCSSMSIRRRGQRLWGYLVRDSHYKGWVQLTLAALTVLSVIGIWLASSLLDFWLAVIFLCLGLLLSALPLTKKLVTPVDSAEELSIRISGVDRQVRVVLPSDWAGYGVSVVVSDAEDDAGAN